MKAENRISTEYIFEFRARKELTVETYESTKKTMEFFRKRDKKDNEIRNIIVAMLAKKYPMAMDEGTKTILIEAADSGKFNHILSMFFSILPTISVDTYESTTKTISFFKATDMTLSEIKNEIISMLAKKYPIEMTEETRSILLEIEDYNKFCSSLFAFFDQLPAKPTAINRFNFTSSIISSRYSGVVLEAAQKVLAKNTSGTLDIRCEIQRNAIQKEINEMLTLSFVKRSSAFKQIETLCSDIKPQNFYERLNQINYILYTGPEMRRPMKERAR